MGQGAGGMSCPPGTGSDKGDNNMGELPNRHKTYHYIVNADHPFPYRIDEGFPIPPGEYIMMGTNDLTDLLYESRWSPEAIERRRQQ